ncbi:MAG: catalase [Ruminococcaceae bacterium]|nr:catalase [Oscillospiraceae bacterium]
MAHCFRAGIFWQGLLHDLSKYQPTEFLAGVRYYQGYRSPNEAERETIGYSAAWMHHKGRNRHHFEFWCDYNPQTRIMQPVEMPIRFVAEMFCDRVAASKIYRGSDYTDRDPLDYFLRAKGKRIIHPATSDLLESLLTDLSVKGEEAVFAQLRAMVKEDRQNRRKHNK